MAGWLNIGSLVLGVMAWSLPIVYLLRYKIPEYRKWVVFSIMSISACAISLCLQIFYTYHLVMIEDWSALMDTTRAVASVSSVLVIVTILLNAITLIVYRGKTV
ncbi:cytochrome c oxidase subunit 4 [Halobacillus dabanensis]|uniref:Cytochrome c oxidase subunit 4 n=1 Tax=Halobacillus dabanensis TaxID=240302 RepID=A0A1I3YPR7_HALDA|nr:hypothetical protein [Halobacillus dabanensis]SFK33261.1 cytochrome c oxidase subunit 4 [Halobacillus dabanensis]